MYLSSVEGPNRRGRPLGRWEDRVKEYMSERGVGGNGLEWARWECMDRERCVNILEDVWGLMVDKDSRGSKGVRGEEEIIIRNWNRRGGKKGFLKTYNLGFIT